MIYMMYMMSCTTIQLYLAARLAQASKSFSKDELSWCRGDTCKINRQSVALLRDAVKVVCKALQNLQSM